MGPDASDEHRDLMERIARDDERALSALVASLGPSLLRFVRRTAGRSASEAEDIVQEVFIRVWKARSRWRPESTVKTYLFTIASRLCMNRARGLRRTPWARPAPEDAEEPARELPDAAPDPERQAFSSQLREAMEGEIAALPANQRAALLLRHSEDLSQQEIAEALDVSVSAVESLLSRARARLRGRLAGWRAEGNAPPRG
jgi:RNA polymerase sigma-70 factor, ECF subfamily